MKIIASKSRVPRAIRLMLNTTVSRSINIQLLRVFAEPVIEAIEFSIGPEVGGIVSLCKYFFV